MNTGIWSSMRPADCLPECWCEAAREGAIILEPFNTWTNLAYTLLGILILKQFIKVKNYKLENDIYENPFYTRVFAFAMIFLGAGSFFFHMSQTFLGQWADLVGMYMVTGFYIVYLSHLLKKMSQTSFLSLYLLMVSVLAVCTWFYPEGRRAMFGFTIAIMLIQLLYVFKKSSLRFQAKYLGLGAGLFILGQVVWNLDRMRIVCDPYGAINGHGIWHILSALGAYFIFKFLATQKR